MGKKLPVRQKWLEHALQGLAFWIGHRHSLFRGYPLSEGALVAEACNLIQSNLPDNLIMLPEYGYKNLVPKHKEIEGVTGDCRVDLALCDIGAKDIARGGNVEKHTKFLIEVKRASASKNEINKDLKRLHNYLVATKGRGARAFLFVVSESSAPKRFVNKGKAMRGELTIPDVDGHFLVRRVIKASASFDRRESAHYVCLIEVFMKGQKASKV